MSKNFSIPMSEPKPDSVTPRSMRVGVIVPSRQDGDGVRTDEPRPSRSAPIRTRTV
jgi:hypothetical protein